MPRNLTVAQKAALRAPVVRLAYLFEGLFDNGALRLWTGIGPLEYGGNIWPGSGLLMVISGLQDSANTEANGLEVSLNGIPPEMAALIIAEPMQNRIVNVYLAMFSESGAMIDTPSMLFAGRGDVPSITDGPDAIEARLTIEGRLVDLQRARKRTYEPADHKIKYPNDKGLDYVPELAGKKVKWGM